MTSQRQQHRSTISHLHRSTVDTVRQSAHEVMMQTIKRLATTIDDGNWRTEDISELLVYLKYHAACSFHAETAALMSHGFPAYHEHEAQHGVITAELRLLLDKMVCSEMPTSSVTADCYRILDLLQRHIDRYDEQPAASCQTNDGAERFGSTLRAA